MKPKKLKLDNYNFMVSLFYDESDRGSAVLAGSYAEHALGDFLLSKVSDEGAVNELFGSNGALSSFSQRIQIARAFGFISKDTAVGLNLIRKVRNDFAHNPLDASYDESPIREWCATLREMLPVSEEHTTSSRHVYLLSCGYFLIGLM